MLSFNGTTIAHLNLVDVLAGRVLIDDAHLLDHEHLAAAAAITALVAEGIDVTSTPAGCLATFASDKESCHYLVSVPVGDGLTPVKVRVDFEVHLALQRLMLAFELAAQAVILNTIAQPGDVAGVSGWCEAGPGKADLILVDARGRVVWQAICRRDIDGVFEAIAAQPRQHLAP